MLTYQDLKAIPSQYARNIFALKVIQEHKNSVQFHDACDGEAYYSMMNPTIMHYKKLLYTITGKAVPDNYTANYKIPSNFFYRFVTQENQYLLGNGVTMDDEHKALLGKDFDTRLQEAGRIALVEGVSFGFWDYDKLRVFKLTEFAPLFDEETGALAAGVRFWQLAPNKPLRFTLYEMDGFTECICRDGATVEVLQEKRAYKLITKQTGLDGLEIIAGENYPTFPIVPLWGNPQHISSIVGLREQIDCFDLIKSGFANDLDVTMLYWILTGTGGMDDIDLAKFVERMKTVHAAVVDGDSGVKVEEHSVDVPYESRTAYLARLEADLYKDAMALDVSVLSSGSRTATEIQAAFAPLNNKTDEFEYCVLDFLDGIFYLAGIEDAVATFKRSTIVNQTEETQMILMAAQYLDDETILRHLPFLSSDEVPMIIEKLDSKDMQRFGIEEAGVVDV